MNTMTQKEITICGKQVTLAYCFATEISYKILSGEDINDFMIDAVAAINEKRNPDTRKSIYLLLAEINAYCESKGKKAPITDKDLMYKSTPEEFGTAVGVAIGLWMDFYHAPKGEEGKKSEDEEKNA